MGERSRDPSRAPTIRDVAAEAGVSKSLVSLVFNEDPRVSDHRRALVLDAAEKLGFRPNWMARSLAAADGNFVAALVENLSNPFAGEVLQLIQSSLHENGLRTMASSALYVDSFGHKVFDEQLLTVLRDMNPSRLVVIGSFPSLKAVQPLADRIPTVIAGGTAEDLAGVQVVLNDDAAGIELVLDHLIGLGHEWIAHVGGDGGGAARNRARAYREVMASRGLERHILVEASDFSMEQARRATERLLSRQKIPTAVVAVNDLAAIGVVTAVERSGLKVPRDIVVTGYDDIFLAGVDRISLTSVSPDNERIGWEAARILQEADGPFGEGAELLIPPRLVVRGSTGSARPR